MPEPPSHTSEAAARRRAGQRRLGFLLLAVLLVIALVVSSTSHGHPRAASVDHKAKRHTAVKHVVVDPLTTSAVSTYISSRRGQVSAAVEDLKTGHEWLLNPSARDQTASIIKVDILETLLYQTAQAGDPITDAEGEEPQEMIEASDDDAATQLWDQISGATGIGAYNTEAGLTQTTPNTEGFWGETLTSAADQIKVLQQLAEPSKLLSTQAQDYELDLMTDIDADQTWGVTGGVPAGVTVALKNGWVPLTSGTDWEINSIGWVKGDKHDYLIAVLTAHDPSQLYGEQTIEKISADVYASLGTEGLTQSSTTTTRTSSSTSTSTTAAGT